MHCLTTIFRKQIVAMFLSLFLVSGGSVWAQFDGQYSQYMMIGERGTQLAMKRFHDVGGGA